MRDPRAELAERIAGEVTLSDDPGATLRKWREEFDVAQTTLSNELDVSASVVSDYESGRRENPGIKVVRRAVEGLLTIDERRGGDRVRQHARVLTAGFDQDVVYDLREYSTTIPTERFYDAIDAEVLCLWASDDAMQPIEYGERLATDLGGTVVELSEAYHWIVEDRPDAYREELRAFLTETDTTGGGE